jgi:hypothetical protein
MKDITLLCPFCQTHVPVARPAVLLAVARPMTDSWYAFQCPRCCAVVDQQAPPSTVAVLIWSGCVATAAAAGHTG